MRRPEQALHRAVAAFLDLALPEDATVRSLDKLVAFLGVIVPLRARVA